LNSITYHCRSCRETIEAPSPEAARALMELYPMVIAVTVKTVCPKCEKEQATTTARECKIEL
jgi:hypothetical protein